MSGSFLAEVGQHAEVLGDLLAFYRGEGRSLLEHWREQAEKAPRIIFTGMGTSQYVADSVIPALASQGLDATSLDAGELLHYPKVIRGLPVLISQSGESVETRKVAEYLDHKGQWVAVTNNPQSTIAQRAGLNLPMLAGQESAISTKTYVNSLALLFLMAQKQDNLERGFQRLASCIQEINPVPQPQIETAAELLADARAIHFVARGPSLAAAQQAALTFMEGTRIPATAFTGGGLRHGPYELIDAAHRGVFFIPKGNTFELLRNMAAEVAGKGSRVVIITDQDFPPPAGKLVMLKVAAHGEDLFNVAAATTQERLLEAIARRRGVIPGQFRNSQKITATE